MTSQNAKVAGILLVVGVIQFIIALVIAEALYPGYSIADNYISDLGVWGNPSAVLFNPSVILLGATSLAAAFYIKRHFHLGKSFVLYALGGLGLLGVGLFPENTFIISGISVFHSIFALLVFIFGGAAAIFTYHLIKSPLRYITLVLGVFSLVAFVLFLGTEDSGGLGIGVGGLERMVVYPATLGLLAFGGYLLGTNDKTV